MALAVVARRSRAIPALLGASRLMLCKCAPETLQSATMGSRVARAWATTATGTAQTATDQERALQEIMWKIRHHKDAPDFGAARSMSLEELVQRQPPEYVNALAQALFEGLGVEQDKKKAFALWKELAERDANDDATYSYAMCLRTGSVGGRTDAARAASLLSVLAERGHAWAAFGLAVMVEEGDGVERDAQRALAMYRTAAAGGVLHAYGAMAEMYIAGRGVPKDEAKATEIFREGADHGSASCAFNLAVRLQEGADGDPTKMREVLGLLKHAAGKGFAPAQFNLGMCFASGVGVELDLERAVACFKEAATGGFPLAMVHLAHMHLLGEGVPFSLNEAIRWYETASEAGVPNVDLIANELRVLGEQVESEEDLRLALKQFVRFMHDSNAGVEGSV